MSKQQKVVDRFNERAPVGTRVCYWTGVREGDGKEGVVSHPATILGGHTPVAWIDTSRGCVALTHVEVTP